MPRPQKQTADYFPHDSNASHTKTPVILRERFGNDGYAFWFLLLEELAHSPGHIVDCQDDMSWAYLAAQMKVTTERAQQIVDALIDLKAIDPELGRHRIFWSQNLVDRLSFFYENRRRNPPVKPELVAVIKVSTDHNPVSTGDNGVSTENNRVSVHEGKGREGKGKERKVVVSLAEPVATETVAKLVPSSKQDSKRDTDTDPEVSAAIADYEKAFGVLSPDMAENIKRMFTIYGSERTLAALQETFKANRKARIIKPLSYVESILDHWQQVEGFKSQRGGGNGQQQRTNITRTIAGQEPSGAFADVPGAS